MPSARRTIVIGRPAEEVFAFFTDPTNGQVRRQHVKEISLAGPMTMGSTIHQVVAGPGGRGMPADNAATCQRGNAATRQRKTNRRPAMPCA